MLRTCNERDQLKRQAERQAVRIAILEKENTALRSRLAEQIRIVTTMDLENRRLQDEVARQTAQMHARALQAERQARSHSEQLAALEAAWRRETARSDDPLVTSTQIAAAEMNRILEAYP